MRSVALALMVAGVTPLAGCRWVAATAWESPAPAATDLPPVERVIPPPDASAVGEPTAPPPPAGYYQLTADLCRDLAYKNSSVANLIEASAVAQPGPLAHVRHDDCADLVRVTAADYLSREARNRTAAAALTLYYKLLELELQSDVLKASLDEVDALVRSADVLRDKGFKAGPEVYDLRKQRIDLLGDRAKLRSGLQKANAELKALLAIDPGAPGFLLPADQVRVAPEPLDADAAVQVGLSRRADLNLIRALSGATDHRTVGAVRRVLVGVTPLLGAVMPTASVSPLLPFVSGMAKAEACQVRRTLHGLLLDRERDAAKEIRTAVEEWGTARDLVAIAKQKVELAGERATDLQKRSQLGQAVEADYRKAKLDLLKLESELIGEIVRWKTADVRAREVLGLLCGD